MLSPSFRELSTDVYAYFKPGVACKVKDNHIKFNISNYSEAILANEYYFSNKDWAKEYFDFCHRSQSFKERWQAACGSWTGKTVLDIGCGPGNVFATLGGSPKLLIGVDVAPTSLAMAAAVGYKSVLADAHDLPFVSGFADLVVLNATLHHCENMEVVLKEAARLVKPGGILLCDHDPQLSAWDYKGMAKMLWDLRLYIYSKTKHSFHKDKEQQYWGLKCEIHHKAGDGVTEALYREVLTPMGFEVNIHPHNHTVGAEALNGVVGKAELKYRLGNLLSGRNPNSKTSALSLMCVARLKNN